MRGSAITSATTKQISATRAPSRCVPLAGAELAPAGRAAASSADCVSNVRPPRVRGQDRQFLIDRRGTVSGVPRRFFFVHVQKTAGTELRERLKRHFAPEAMYPDKTDGDLFVVAPQVSVGQLLARWEQRKDEIRVITGHFPYSTIELIDAEFVTLSVLREPVERALSHLRHHRKMTPEMRDSSLEQIYDDVFHRVYFHNHMVKMFSLTADEIAASAAKNTWAVLRPIEFTAERLERAKQQVTRLDVLGLQDHFDDFCDELIARFGWGLGEPLYANRTPEEPASDSLRARIAADNALDVELYEYARELYAERRSGR